MLCSSPNPVVLPKLVFWENSRGRVIPLMFLFSFIHRLFVGFLGLKKLTTLSSCSSTKNFCSATVQLFRANWLTGLRGPLLCGGHGAWGTLLPEPGREREEERGRVSPTWIQRGRQDPGVSLVLQTRAGATDGPVLLGFLRPSVPHRAEDQIL